MSYFESFVPGEGSEFTPSQTLLASILETALLDFARPGTGYTVTRHRENATRWLFGRPLEGAGFDFQHVCDALDLDPSVVRRLALANRERLFPVAENVDRRNDPMRAANCEGQQFERRRDHASG